jgi:hypothetical protein
MRPPATARLYVSLDAPTDNHFPTIPRNLDFEVAKSGQGIQKLRTEFLNLSEIIAMKLPTFVSASALILVGWLFLSFQHQGTPSHYPKPAKDKTHTAMPTKGADSLISAISPSP